METKMKGLLKGLRYISQIFDSKEAEMQIGFPTDVKHVAHIGWDSQNQASTNGPSWMNEYKSGEQTPQGSGHANLPSSGYSNNYQDREFTEDKQLTRPPRRTSSGDAASPKYDMQASSRQTQRRYSASSGTAGTSGEPDAPAVPKQSKRRKPKGSGISSGKSKSKGMVAAQEFEADEESAMPETGAARPQMITGRGDGDF
ncbi:ROP-INTERACTIVE CRIB MOTIF-CONTAINING protein 5 [Rhynchospora pubera]|uniref:ROP-INTERACTIVE CRIB MOTIF-CONTAINING protein 5 n=1 Tax=Rhynchospora pubera TaxID=906938 RepID=A0AAV8EDS7_9POAL|nr:ROP-INTERACTIVE CRIB MOTIF-CONTAINING protein 5 [Rhynchospora pubera]